jgi:hypothetical protein
MLEASLGMRLDKRWRSDGVEDQVAVCAELRSFHSVKWAVWVIRNS